MEHPVRVEEEREGGTGPRGRDRGGKRPHGVAVWVAGGIIRVVLGVADSPCGCGVRIWLSGLVLERGMEHPARVEEEREGGTGHRGRDRGEGICQVECIMKVVGGRAAVQSTTSTFLVWWKTYAFLPRFY